MNRRRFARQCLLAVVALLASACGGDGTGPPPGQPLAVYASHNAADTAAVLEAYRAATGQRFRLLTDDLAEDEIRLADATTMPDADLFLAASLAEAWAVAEADALRPVYLPGLVEIVPSSFRDPEFRWFALSRRARIVVYNRDEYEAGDLGEVQQYAALGDPAWSGRLCLSSSAVPGNRALVAALIRKHGVREAELVVRRWRVNLGMSVFTNDGTLLEAIADGRCGIGIADSNVLAAAHAAERNTAVAAHWFDDPAETLVDVSAAAVTRHAVQPEAAQALLDWLTSPGPNGAFAGRRYEFPLIAGAPVDAAIVDWQGHLPATAPLAELGFLLEDADRLIERARYP